VPWGSTQPLKMSTRKTPGGKDGPCVRVTTLAPSWCRKSRKFENLNLLVSQRAAKLVAGNLYLYLYTFVPFQCLDQQAEALRKWTRSSVQFTFPTRFFLLQLQHSSRDSSVGFMTRPWAGRPGLESWLEGESFLQSKTCSLVLGTTQSVMQWIPGFFLS
jgi:hypothetical protein